ncbi:MAG: glycerol-3-phosphate dehydrogenase C-terminal domain-containing protein [Cytophagales bacterium]|nr:glycerol-3-phosphate dehydrogenase C-terminal domain-containing protein [Cytophagales bacterium]
MILAKACFAIHYEMSIYPLDFIIRRSGLLFFNRPKIARWINPVIDYFAQELEWSDEERAAHLVIVTEALGEVIRFE